MIHHIVFMQCLCLCVCVCSYEIVHICFIYADSGFFPLEYVLTWKILWKRDVYLNMHSVKFAYCTHKILLDLETIKYVLLNTKINFAISSRKFFFRFQLLLKEVFLITWRLSFLAFFFSLHVCVYSIQFIKVIQYALRLG